MPQTIEFKRKGVWLSLLPGDVYTEDVRGYLIVKFVSGRVAEFRPVEWRILED